MRVAITGSTGTIGTFFKKENQDIEFVDFKDDIRDFAAVSNFINKLENVSSILHLAALVPTKLVGENIQLAFDINVGGTLNLMLALKSLKETGRQTPHFLYVSTSHVYKPQKTPITENSKLTPSTLYGLTKLQGEQWCEQFSRSYDLKIGIARVFSFSSHSQDDCYFIPAMIKKIIGAKHGETLEISGVRGKRDFLRVPQICTVLRFAIENKIEDHFNVGIGKGVYLSSIIEKIAKKAGRSDLKFNFTDENPSNLVSNPKKMHRIGIKLESELDLLLDEMLSSYRKKIM